MADVRYLVEGLRSFLTPERTIPWTSFFFLAGLFKVRAVVVCGCDNAVVGS